MSPSTTTSSASGAFVAGHVAGMAGVIAGAPFDIVKVKMQTKAPKETTSRYLRKRPPFTALECARRIFKHHGSLGFYHGIVPPMLAVGVQKSTAFGVYAAVRQRLQGHKSEASMAQVMLAGAAGGIVNSIILCPVDQMKIALQVQRSKISSNTSASPRRSRESMMTTLRELVSLHRSHPIRAFYGAMTAVIIREIPGYALYFGTYELLVRTYRNHVSAFNDDSISSKNNNQCRNNTTTGKWVNFMAGGIAGMTMWSIYYPLDFLKSRAQARNATLSDKVSLLRMASSIYQTQGLGAFYRGIGPAVCRAFPTHASIFLVYESILSYLDDHH